LIDANETERRCGAGQGQIEGTEAETFDLRGGKVSGFHAKPCFPAPRGRKGKKKKGEEKKNERGGGEKRREVQPKRKKTGGLIMKKQLRGQRLRGEIKKRGADINRGNRRKRRPEGQKGEIIAQRHRGEGK